MLQILCKTPAAIFKIQILANTKSKFNSLQPFLGFNITSTDINWASCPNDKRSIVAIVFFLAPIWSLGHHQNRKS